MPDLSDPPEWVRADEFIDTQVLFTMFLAFWRENSYIWKEDIAGYSEAAPHLVFQAFFSVWPMEMVLLDVSMHMAPGGQT